ncbi:small G protein signaling modulator 1 isoform X1 [Danio rerio]|uniref:Small G protein signaling modulator 1 isoform X1 n=1 Tax=Danio rerio TaxID=7955 RepID=A0AC58GL05_DANRE
MGESETRQRLLRNVKKEVKQIMEEAVTRKFVHEDSSHIISFCGVVEACVLHGLKRRAAGFLRSNKLAALFMKVGKMFPPAEDLCRKVQELEQIIENKQNQSQMSQESVRKQPRPPNLSPLAIKHLWIRTALTQKLLDKIVLYLVENSSKFYEREALLRDPVDGPILASLLVGPCALEYTKAKTANHFWTDPSADELVQRHRIHSGHCRQDSPTKRPALIQKRQSSGSMDDRPSLWARDYVESLHQNSRATLLFGKNNVLVQPTDDMEAIPGYLSLHQTADLMTLKWTPNQLMNGNTEFDYEKSVYWDFAMTIRLEEIVYLHCHQQVDSGGTVVLVSQDGIQRPPFRFPKGGHLLQFLTCLETGLLPHGQLDPPLWSQRGKGKVFPKLRKRSPHGSCESFSDKDEDEATDYVFRIIYPGSQEFVAPELIEQAVNMWQPTPRKSSCSSCSQNGSSDGGLPNGCNHDRAPLKLLCETMKHQIISRAFYGWLAYCRHLSTVRTHLSALVNATIVEPDIPYDAKGGLSADVWKSFLQDCSAYEEEELLRLVYYGGVEPSLRKEVWPFLLGHYHFTMSPEERKEVDEQIRACYEQTMSEWLGCEAIVRQREKEQHAAALAKCASGASVDRGSRQDSTISTDSSQSSNSDKQSHAGSHSDSNSSTQVFGSVDEVDPIESEPKPKDEKPQPKIPNGALPNCTSSPDSGHPSSRNFSVTSAMSDCSPSTEETSTQESKGNQPDIEEKPKEEQPENSSTTQNTDKAAITTQNKSKLQTSETSRAETDQIKDAISKNPTNLSEPKEDEVNAGAETRKSEVNKCEVQPSRDPAEESRSSESKQAEDADPVSLSIVDEDTKSNTEQEIGLKVNEDSKSQQSAPESTPEDVKTSQNLSSESNTKQETSLKVSEDSKCQPSAPESTSEAMTTSQNLSSESNTEQETGLKVNEDSKCQPSAPESTSEDMKTSQNISSESNTEQETGLKVNKDSKSEQSAPKSTPEHMKTSQNLLSELNMEQATGLKVNEDSKCQPSAPESTPEAMKTSQNISSESNTQQETGLKVNKDSKSEQSAPKSTPEHMKTSQNLLSELNMEQATGLKVNEDSKCQPSAPESTLDDMKTSQNLSSGPQNVPQTAPQTISWDSEHNRARSIIKQMTESESESCGPLTSLSKPSPDMSDDSPSALEMEEIPSSVVYMSSETSMCRTPLTLARPVAPCIAAGEKSPMGMPALELCMEPGVNTTPEGTDSALSEEEPEMDNLFPKPDSLAVTGDKNDIASPVSSIGTTYSQELVDLYTLNLHRIDKDVQRCDRNYWYFTPANLEKLRNIMCSYVWQHLDIGYVQGMCDLLAPLLVILDDEAMAFSCFTELMKRMNQNFPHGGAMDTHFANMRSLIQILDSELFELMQQNGDYTHFYFCYRWFLLDFKREMVYDDVFSVWETIWAARYASSEHFVLFIALALVELYRDIILENNMDFTDIIKFFNEMAERHDVPKLLVMARDLVHKVQILIENK